MLNVESHLKMDGLNIQVEDWGVDFPIRNALKKQDDYWAERVYDNAKDRLIFVEHEPVYTAGASLSYNFSLEKIRPHFKVPFWSIICPVKYTRRGGLVTYQGPGILSVYCVFKTGSFIPGILNNILLSSAEKVFEEYKLKIFRRTANSSGNPGLYLGRDKKIVSVGLQFSRGVSRYGMTISLDPEEKYLDPLVPCGLKDIELTALAKELGQSNIPQEQRLKIKTILALQIQKRWNSHKQKTPF
ncbi:hypothetical protein A2930_01285 [Candidatus Giovannonibacteria bacterium RIFCSPLOWO2_01_FULL_45_34]|uniref:Octanoyltransferase n=1 Tax=Candidatus Giovannonibacteria bacterium RIFCSPLOWO2_01_FULL_45_34 TaxID=1798351 RepID=A0A1F5X1G0_9BACT|nr:MAG: hypothetical protein A2930_01285 [Candidatus Giovannonibacteria bacterium RIFCSPLOWO2_01_FULL_45_34]